MFIQEKMHIKAVDINDNSFTGYVYKIVVQLCDDDNNKPHALIFLSQDRNYIETEGDFGCVSLWVDKLKSIEVFSICDNKTKTIKDLKSFKDSNQLNKNIAILSEDSEYSSLLEMIPKPRIIIETNYSDNEANK